MPSKPNNIIGNLRRRYEPHAKLEANVDLNHQIIHQLENKTTALEKQLTDLPKIHSTLSKSFGMQRKTLVRVLGLEKRVKELEQARESIDEIIEEVNEEYEEVISEVIEGVIEDVEEEVGGDVDISAPVATIEDVDEEVGGDDKSNIITLDGEKKPPFKINKRIIKVKDLKRGTSQESIENIQPNNQVTDLAIREPKPTINPEVITPEVLPPEEEPKKTTSVGEGLKNILNSIAGTTEDIKSILIGEQKADKEAAQDAAEDAEDAKRGKQEKKLETKVFDGVKKVGEKVLKPVQGLFSRIWGFLKKVLLADILRRLFNWLGDDKNKKKLGSIFRFVKDFWPLLMTGFLLFGTGLGSLITGTVSAIAGFIPILAGLLPTLIAFAASPIGLAVLGTTALVGGGMIIANQIKGDKGDINVEESGTKNFNKGGSVPGQGNTDTVPAMLTPGEFVLTKEATEKYGTDTLEGMNAAAATGKKETSGIGRGIGSAVGGLAGGVVGFFADSPVSPVADIALGLAGSAAGGEIGDNVERKVRGMNKGGVVQYLNNGGQAKENKPTAEDFGLRKDFNYDNPEHREEFVKVISPHLKNFMEQQNAAVDENPDAYNGIKLKMDRDGRMPNFGEFIANQSEAAFNNSVGMVQSNESIPPEARQALLQKMTLIRKETLDNPNFKGDIAFDINRDIPGTAAYRLLMAEQEKKKQPKVTTWREMEGEASPFSADDIARLKNRRGMNKGGLVQHFNKGGLVQHFNRGGLVRNGRVNLSKLDLSKHQGGLSDKDYNGLTYGQREQIRRAQLKQRVYKEQGLPVPTRPNVLDGTRELPQRRRPKQGYDSDDPRSKKAKGIGLGRMLGGAADFLTGNLTDFDGKGGKTFGISRVIAGAADALTGNKWDFDKHGKPDTPSAQIVSVEPPSVEISPPGSTPESTKANITSINAPAVQPTVSVDADDPVPEIPTFSATLMRSVDKIKTLGIMV